MRVSTEAEYPKPSCDDAEQPPACAGWAASGECVKNFPFMSQAWIYIQGSSLDM